MIKILDNLEEIKELSGNLKTIMEEDEMLETRLLNLRARTLPLSLTYCARC